MKNDKPRGAGADKTGKPRKPRPAEAGGEKKYSAAGKGTAKRPIVEKEWPSNRTARPAAESTEKKETPRPTVRKMPATGKHGVLKPARVKEKGWDVKDSDSPTPDVPVKTDAPRPWRDAPKSRSNDADAPKQRTKSDSPRPWKDAPRPVSSEPDATARPDLRQAMAPKRYINVYLGLGSNLGDRRANIRSASAFITKEIGKIARASHLYETQPWGVTDQEPFLNQVIMINTSLDPRDLLKEITKIERELGRVRKDNEKWGPRPIDIDILLYGKRIVRDKGLEVPHPEMHKRAFVLVPLMEIAPDIEHPILKQQIDELYMACDDLSEVIRLDY